MKKYLNKINKVIFGFLGIGYFDQLKYAKAREIGKRG